MEHIFRGLLEISFRRERGKRNFPREEINSENVTFGHGGREIALVESTMFRRWSNIPNNLSMFTKCSTSVSTSEGYNFSARRSNRCSIEILVAKK